MNRRVGFVGILIADPARHAPEVNAVISAFSGLVLARVGLPPHGERADAVVTLVVEATTDELGALTGRLGRLPGVSVKSALGRGADNGTGA
jgi:putative iron-only hydrogenase system regulator